MPVTDATEEELVRKKGAFETTQSTTHWPNAMHVGGVPIRRQDGNDCPYNDWKPRQPVKLTERGLRLTGIPYIKASA